jgi:glycerol-3-phosphate dehydrogenase
LIERCWPPAASYDVVVVGGGITGVCVAREAAGRGLSTLLVEKTDVGAGTSSATTKYVHGGLRYLEQRQFGVVRESLRERTVLGLAAPHLVRPRRFLLPAWRWSSPPTALLAAGLVAYEALAFDKNRGAPAALRTPRVRWAGRAQVLRAVPWLDPDGLQGAFAYYDSLNVHPERLLLQLLASAVAEGARMANHARVTGLAVEEGTVVAVDVRDELGGSTARVRATAVVNCAGPWVGEVLAGLPSSPVRVRPSKGVHLLTEPLGGADSVFARARDGRHFVVSPWQGASFIGPTDTAVDGAVDGIAVTEDDVQTILDTVNSASTRQLSADDVRWATVGVRPLVEQAGVDSYRSSRRAEHVDHARDGLPGLWSVTGGKWTTGRATAETVVTALATGPLSPRRPFDSRRAALADGFADWPASYDEVVHARPEVDLPVPVREHLARLYGAGARRVLDLVAADPRLGRALSTRPGRFDVAAQVVHGVTAEAARTLDDLVDRRLVLGTLGPPTRDELEEVAAVAAPLLGWDGTAAARAVDERLARDAAVLAVVRRAGAVQGTAA